MILSERAEQYTDPFFKEAFSILSRGRPCGSEDVAGDSVYSYSHSLSDLDELHELMYTSVKERHIRQAQPFRSVEEVRRDVLIDVTRGISRIIAGDSDVYNEATGIGTLLDPQTYSRASIPVMLGPSEQAALYSNGGLAGLIIDKKSLGMVSTGITFKSFDDKFWTHDKISKLEEAAELTGCNAVLADLIRDALVFGGAVSYPIFKRENIGSFTRPLDTLPLEPGCIDRWVTADRWNVVFVPNFTVTAEDYLRPKTIYLPLGGHEVNTSRVVMLRPKSMPYWATIMNIGWAPSDYTGFIRSLYAYMMVALSVPIMAQQMSLLLYQMPLDAITAQLGADTVKKLMAINEEKMKEWSVLRPKAVNIVGELNVVNRQFSGFEHFFGAVKSDLAANCGIAEPILFHTPNKGFSDNTQEALLKESETMKMLQRSIEPQLVPHTDALVAHVFGTDSEEWKQRRRLWMSFDKPMTSTQKDLAEVGARFAATVASLAAANVPTDAAVKIASQFFKEVDIDDGTLEEIKKEVNRIQRLEEEGLKVKKDFGGVGHTIASPGSAGNTGAFTKPQEGAR